MNFVTPGPLQKKGSFFFGVQGKSQTSDNVFKQEKIFGGSKKVCDKISTKRGHLRVMGKGVNFRFRKTATYFGKNKKEADKSS